MTRTRRQIEKNLKQIDIVTELIDARIPVSSRNPSLRSIINNKPKIILLNKCDMADPALTKEWLEFFKSRKEKALAVDCKSGKGINQFLPACKEVLSEQIEAWNRKGMVGRSIRTMIVGVPNVGKSSFINRMCKGLAGKADVQDRPGVTRENRWFTIGKGFELLDTPGILWPKFDDKLVGEHLAFTGAVRDEVVDIEDLASRLLEELLREYKPEVCERYKLADEEIAGKTGYEILSVIARKRGMLISGGEVNTERAAFTVLDEFRAAKIGKITLEKVKK